MAVPMTSTELISQLKKWGVNYKEYENWETHNRNHIGKWGPVNGFMWHHTGSDDSDQRELLTNGYGDLPGPLCHFGIAQDGTVWLIGWGRANHAGLGDNDVLEAVINESEIPTDNEANVDGNARFYGAEFWYSGSHTMTEAQYKSGILLSCAIVDFHNWSGKSIIGHGEWQPGKWDPGYKSGFMMNMDITRHDINTRLAMGPNPVTTPDPVKPEAKPQAYSDVWKTDAMRAPSTKTSTENPYWEAESMLRYAAEQAAKANAKADKLLKHFGIE